MRKISTISRLLAVLILLISLCSSYSASLAQSLPSSADPTRLSDNIKNPGLPYSLDATPQNKITPDDKIPEADQGFVLKSVDLLGGSIFYEGYFTPLINRYIEKKLDINGLNHLAQMITYEYREHGYLLARAVIPQQEIINGHVDVQIIEGRLYQILIDDPQKLLDTDKFNIMNRTIERIKKMNHLHGPTLERYVLLLNDVSGLMIKTIIQPSVLSKEPGHVDLTFLVLEKESSLKLSYDNHGSRYIGPHQLGVTYLTGNAINSFDTLVIQANGTTQRDEIQFLSFDYSWPIHENGLTFGFGGSLTQSEPGYTLRDLEVESQSAILDAYLSYPVIRSRRENLLIGTRFSILNSSTEFLDEELIDDKVRYASIFSDYNFIDIFEGQSFSSLTFSHGLNAFGATETGDNKLSREDGISDFVKVEFSLDREQLLNHDFSLLNSLQAQYSPDSLLSSQEFGYGGSSIGRAYDPSEITGDNGLSGSVQLFYNGISPVHDWYTLTLRPYVFFDIGKVWNNDADDFSGSGSSAGFGTQYSIYQSLYGSLDIAFPLTRSVENPIMNGEDGPRILLKLTSNL